MRSSGRNSRDTGRQNYRGTGGDSRRQAGGGRDERPRRDGRPRPEERRYDVGFDRDREGGRGRDERRPGDRDSRGRDDRGRDDRGRDDRGRDDRGRDDRRPADRDRDRDREGRGRAGRDDRDRGARTTDRDGRPGRGPAGSPGQPGRGGPRRRQGRPEEPGGRRRPGPGRGPARRRSVPRRPSAAPARPREYEAQIEERNRARHRTDRPKPPTTFGEPEGERLQKVLARAGMGSRRACEELIDQRRVEVNGRIVTEQGLRVDPEKDEVKVDGLTVATQSYLFFALNKPAGVVSTMEDPDGRQCLGDYVTNRETRLFHVGRLDTETEGIILLTNHGELAHRLTHPRYGVRKTYLAAIQGPIPRDLGKRLKDGIQLEDGYARADHFRVVENTGKNYLVEVSLHEGRKHIVRRMLSEAGFPVDRLVRTGFGPIALGDQKSGWLRRLTNTEVGMLMREVEL
ncbi:pseudouridine synthase [Streptomyces sp. MNU89]|uniref:pseudouridine synthase n=1 Tax=Streptomyces sp. MNU89 TaxID=2560025 RepID=UPI001E5DC67F|nr:pseudouridine synthase [Streptomyces sp. MNU89]MCC9742325.1 rRNA pseudouridine synthase [Streptomyces sp. MNU89]